MTEIGKKERAYLAKCDARRERERRALEKARTERLLHPTESPRSKRDERFDQMTGAQILDVGFVRGTPDGGLAIDYRKGTKDFRIVFGYTELGCWVDWAGELK